MTYIGSAQHKTRTALLELTMLLGLLLTQTVHAAPATMFSPVNGATFASTSVTFTWEDVGAIRHGLWIGSRPGGDDLYASYESGTTTTVTDLPNDGSTVYVRLWTQESGGWGVNDYTYTAYRATEGGTPATLVSPANGATFTSNVVTFTWDNVGATRHGMWIGSSPGDDDLYASYESGTTATVTDLPNNGMTVYVRLWSEIDGAWGYHDANYTTYTEDVATGPATIISPVNGATFESASVTFTWEDVDATRHGMWIGSSPGGNDLYDSYESGATTTVNNLPNNGMTVYVRLWSEIDGSWYSTDTSYTTETLSPPSAAAAYCESSGMVVFEAEHYSAEEGFATESNSQASNDKIIQVGSSGGQVNYTIHLNNGGRWYVWLRTLAKDHYANGLYLHLDGQEVAAPSDHPEAGWTSIYLKKSSSTWHWTPEFLDNSENHHGPVTIDVSSGTHMLSISKRKVERPLIDKIVLTRTNQAPTGFGPSETPCN